MAEVDGERGGPVDATNRAMTMLARNRWKSAGRTIARENRSRNVMTQLTSMLETAKPPFYLSPGGADVSSIADMTEQFVLDEEMQRLEQLCAQALDMSGDVIDSIGLLGGSAFAQEVLSAHTKVADFLSVRRAAALRRSMTADAGGGTTQSASWLNADGGEKDDEAEPEPDEDDPMSFLEDSWNKLDVKKAYMFKGAVKPKSKDSEAKPKSQVSPRRPAAAEQRAQTQEQGGNTLAGLGLVELARLSQPIPKPRGSLGRSKSTRPTAGVVVDPIQASAPADKFSRQMSRQVSLETVDTTASHATGVPSPCSTQGDPHGTATVSPARDMRQSVRGGLRFVRAGASMVTPRRHSVQGGPHTLALPSRPSSSAAAADNT